MVFFFQAEDGIRDRSPSRGLGDVYKRQGYTREERKFMTDTILRHRDMKEESESFASIFYRADKLSRDCIHCKARQECYWPEEKKNNKYIY